MGHNVSFGSWLKQRRTALRLTRAELAQRVHCAVVTLRKIEEDARRPSAELAAQLADHLALAPEERRLFIRVARGERAADQLLNAHSHALPQQHALQTRTSDPIRHTNLPAPLTSFIGRDSDVVALATLLDAHRLVTITGVGGVGKTRLAIAVGTHFLQSRAEVFPDGVWMVELASLAQASLVVPAIARLFKLPDQSDRAPLDLLQEHLADKRLLLVIDNCEHLIDACADMVSRLLPYCWQVRILATSREELSLPGEALYQVAPLALPEPFLHTSAPLRESAAVQVFLDRMHRPHGHLSAAEMTTIGLICRRLDGIPLALELAAPLAQHMPLADIAAQLHDQMATLVNTYRAAVPRHRTMQSALEWSYRLLAPAEQHCLFRASVFRNGWTHAAAEAVCGEAPVRSVLPALQQLVATSLVLVAEQPNGEPRYRMLEPVRQFAQGLLAASGESEHIARRHAAYFRTLAECMSAARDTPAERAWLERLEPERDNLRAVNLWALARGEREFVQYFNGALFAFWIYCSTLTEANHWLTAALTLPEPADEPSHAALMAEISALDAAGYAAVLRVHYEQAIQWFERSFQLGRRIGDQRVIAGALRGRGFIAMIRGDFDQAQRLSTQALALSQEIADARGGAWALYDLGYLALERGDLPTARSWLEEALSTFQDLGIPFGAFRAFLALGQLWRRLGDPVCAHNYYQHGLRLQQQLHYLHYVADGLEGLGGIVATTDSWRAARLFGAAHAHREAITMPRWQHQQAWYDADLAIARRRLHPADWQAAWASGTALTLENAVAEALA